VAEDDSSKEDAEAEARTAAVEHQPAVLLVLAYDKQSHNSILLHGTKINESPEEGSMIEPIQKTHPPRNETIIISKTYNRYKTCNFEVYLLPHYR
jgi:hypothetical protein